MWHTSPATHLSTLLQDASEEFPTETLDWPGFSRSYTDSLCGPFAQERCNPGVPDCSACQRSYYEVGAVLANTSNPTILTLCVLFMSAQYLARFDTLQAVTDRLNCYFVFPPPLALGLPAPPSKTWASTGAILGIASGCAALVALAGLLVYGGCRPRWRRHHVLPHVQLQRFSLAALRRATDNWDERRLLGEGGWGRVYRGTLRSGEEVAVKVATHKNLVRRAKVSRDGWTGGLQVIRAFIFIRLLRERVAVCDGFSF